MAYKCPQCDYEHDNLISLSLHFRRKHKGTAKQLRIELFHGGVEPTCACGCGTPVKFHAIQMGFSEYTWGHAARVNNNWGHNESAQKKSQDVRREMHERGEIKIWNRGKTKEDDEKIATYGEKGSKTILSQPNELKRRSEGIKHSWEIGAITPFTGSAHPQWKGGTSVLLPIARSHLHGRWTYPKLRAAGFKCTRCGESGKELNVHHTGERFAEILHRAIVELGDPGNSFEKKSLLAEWVADYHVSHEVPGDVLCHDCHVVVHNELEEEIN
jgi:hypothetical protein